jgi:hypothetical protein
MSEEVRLRRLISRHVAFGRSTETARAWALGPDQRNAELILGCRAQADAFVAVG